MLGLGHGLGLGLSGLGYITVYTKLFSADHTVMILSSVHL